MMAGTASINPVLFTLSILLLLAWKIAGWYGIDRWLLPALGTPRKPGKLFTRGTGEPTT
jgi:thiosulfate dehydrogenase [quinone] large subunit